ncbi:hypothetical protein M1146_00040 [Patescibacteria group bacterium]|nr:hypothetical protein [Patescibacteria group bacterium]
MKDEKKRVGVAGEAEKNFISIPKIQVVRKRRRRRRRRKKKKEEEEEEV